MSTAGTVNQRVRNPEAEELRAKFVWCGIVVGLLTLQVAMGLAAVTLSTGDASFAVAPRYHEQALGWDENQAVARKSADLAWTASINASVTADALGRRTLMIALHDRDHRSVSGARMEAVLFHHARANEVQNAVLQELEGGAYQATLPMRQAGLWEIRLNVTRGDERFVATHQVEVGTTMEGTRP